MTLLSIRERGTSNPGPVVCIDGQEYAIQVQDPFDARAEGELEWYFERHLQYPFKDQVRAQQAAASIPVYGEQLFRRVFADPEAYACYRAATQGNLADLIVEIAGSPVFQRLHWEALKDPKLAQPLSLQVTFVRRNLTPTPKARLREAPTINVLLVTARPGGRGDVGYRTIQRPLVETLRQAKLRVHVDILQPGTYKALTRHLKAVQERHGKGYYHVVHFDVHGALLTFEQFDEIEKAPATDRLTFQAPRYGRPPIPEYAGVKAFLSLERVGGDGQHDVVEATELAGLLQMHGVPIVVLKACLSGKQAGDRETSLGSQLMQAGVQMVLAMGYSVTVSAAERLMQEFYRELFGGASLPAALRSARLELHNRKDRRASYNQTIQLEDWLLPVVYENQPQALKLRELTPEESRAYFEAQAAGYGEPQVPYRFVGRDLDVLEIERRLLGRGNILLLRGMGGAGKTTLLHHLGWWWQRTGFVEQVFYFGYDQRAWTRQQIMDAIARKLLGDELYRRHFQPLGLDAQQHMLAERLRATRHLLILDNLESVTGAELAIQHTLSEKQQEEMHRFVSALAGGKTLVLLGLRGPEEWLKAGTFEDNVYTLPGLDPQAASELADLVLKRHNAAQYRGNADLERLIKLLDGYPLALEVVLPNLERQKPEEVLQALVSGGAGIGAGEMDLANPDIQKKTQSILHCIAYSHSNLAPEAPKLLLCLAPFTEVIYLPGLEAYTEALKRQPVLAELPFDGWGEVLEQTMNWGLLAWHEVEGFLQIQPTLPYFLRTRLGVQQQAPMRESVETAFREHCGQLGIEIAELCKSKVAQERQTGLALARIEYENLARALALALEFLGHLQDVTNERRSNWTAVMYHQLGIVAQAQRQWAQAEGYYQQALAIYVEFNDRYAQAGTYHQLGIVAEEQRQWAQAREYYLTALRIGVEYHDEYRIGTRLQTLSDYWQQPQDATLPAAVAEVLGVTKEEAEHRLAKLSCEDE